MTGGTLTTALEANSVTLGLGAVPCDVASLTTFETLSLFGESTLLALAWVLVYLLTGRECVYLSAEIFPTFEEF